jgi:hypothetical protein
MTTTTDVRSPGPDSAPVSVAGQQDAPSCCSAEKQASCCEESAKSSCCGADATAGGGCGCRVSAP